MQTTGSIVMVRPANFGFNPDTAKNNFYQQQDGRTSEEIRRLSQLEFDQFVALLQDQGVQVVQVEDTVQPIKPDAVFPNNWFSTHTDGRVILYPMFSPSRRLERRKEVIETLMEKGFQVNEIIDLSFFEEDEQYLEGTGSMVMDHDSRVIYACLSERTHSVPLAYLSKLIGYELIAFEAMQAVGGTMSPIYHTNVMMHVGSDLAVVCLESILNTSDRLKVQHRLTDAGKKVIPISAKQKFHFAGNMLELTNAGDEKFTVMSQTAYESLQVGQIQQIEKFTTIISPQIPTIEKLGGGSARCMMAELFLPNT